MDLIETRNLLQNILLHNSNIEVEEEKLSHILYKFTIKKYKLITTVISYIIPIAIFVTCILSLISSPTFHIENLVDLIGNIMFLIIILVYTIISWIITKIFFWIIRIIINLIDKNLMKIRSKKQIETVIKINERIAQEQQAIDDLFLQLDESIVPTDYLYIEAVDYFIFLYENKRVKNITEAINIYESDQQNLEYLKHQQQIILNQQQIIQNQNQIDWELQSIRDECYYNNKRH